MVITRKRTSKFLFVAIILCTLRFVPLYGQVTYQEAYPNLSFNFPVEIQNSNDGTDRIFIVQQTGEIKVFTNINSITEAQTSTFLDLSQKVSYSSGQEIGLLGLAFHPNYSQNGYFYVYYTKNSEIAGVTVEIVLSRFQVSSDNPNIADSNSEFILFSFDKNQSNSNHNGGKIEFGPDGYLYISVGDGGGGGDPQGNAQNLNTAFGSILRIDIDLDGNNPVETNPDLPNGNYEIPSDNPIIGQSGLDELYAWGIRNTWKFSFDFQTNRLWGADVGQDGFEEINLIQSGGNYGWNRFEANSVENGSTDLITTPDIKPVFFYGRNDGDVSITGGYVYRGSSSNTSLQGKYIYGDYISGRVWALEYNPSSNSSSSELLFRTNGQFISSFGLDEAGELYFSDYGSNAKIYKIIGGNNEPQPVAVDGVGSWSDLNMGTNGIVHATAIASNNKVYIAGEFTNAGGIGTNNLAIYDPIDGWESLGSGTNGKVNTVAIANNGDVYIGGEFNEVSGISANNMAVWNGTEWQALGNGTNGPVAKIGIDGNSNIYVGGAFETAGGVIVNNIALWNDNTWSSLTDVTTGLTGTNNEIRAIAFDEDNTLYVGGNFDTAGGNSAPRIATWDGTSWGTLGQGTSGFVQAITITPDYIYAGGNFSIAGGQTVNRVARWNRSLRNWQSLGEGLSGNVNAMKHDGYYLYTGGSFETASDETNINKIVNNIARWSDNSGWQALGIGKAVGVDNQVNTLTFSNSKATLYVGGNFSNAGERQIDNIATWTNGEEGQESLPPDNFSISTAGNVCRNSATGKINVTAKNTHPYSVKLIGNEFDENYVFTNTLEITDLKPETYDLCITTEDFPGYEKCFKASITQPGELTIESAVNEKEKKITLKMSGGANYNINLNGNSIQTQKEEITLFLNKKVNTIEVTTDKKCQGEYKETILISNVSVYPNPFEEEINIFIENSISPKGISIFLYSSLGKLLYSKVVQKTNKTVTIDTPNLNSGFYILQLKDDNSESIFKLLKL